MSYPNAQHAHDNRPRGDGTGPNGADYGLFSELMRELMVTVKHAAEKHSIYPDFGPPCPQNGAPYPVMPTMCPGSSDKVFGCEMPYEKMGCKCVTDAVKQLCYVETTLRSPEPVPAGETIEFTIEVKWWWQPQKVLNLGDQVNRSFDLTHIQYGQSNYSLDIHQLQINGTGAEQNGIDIRRWNQTSFLDKNYPFPAAGLDDAITLRFRNTSSVDADLEIIMGGPAFLQIG